MIELLVECIVEATLGDSDSEVRSTEEDGVVTGTTSVVGQ